MTYPQKNFLFFLIVVILGVLLLWPAGIYDGRTDFSIQLITYINFVVFVTSMVCLKEFFLPGENNRYQFHVFNIIFIVSFYSISLAFLFVHRDAYEGYAHLSLLSAVVKFALRWDIFSIMFWIIMFTLVVNIIYAVRHRQSYLQYN